jgi:hypothetical protein
MLAARFTHTRIAGGLALTEATAVAVIPNRESASLTVMIVTVAAKRRMAALNASRSSVASSADLFTGLSRGIDSLGSWRV